LNSCDTNLKTVTSVVEHHQNVFILHREPDAWKVKICLADNITKRKDLFEFDKISNDVAVMAVSDRYVVVTNPITKQMMIYDFMSEQIARDYCSLDGLLFLPDGCLLGVCEGKLQKYGIENGQLVELWTCDEIEDGYSLCTDFNGLIYMSTGLLKKICIVSSQGAANNNKMVTI